MKKLMQKTTIDEIRNEIIIQLREMGLIEMSNDVRTLKNRGIVFRNVDTINEMMNEGTSLESAVEYILDDEI